MSASVMRAMIIEEVRKRPMLYDNSLECHRNISMRQNAWVCIAKKLGLQSGKHAQNMWRGLRDKYCRRRRLGMAVKYRWEHDRAMNFLDGYLRRRPLQGSRLLPPRMPKLEVDFGPDPVPSLAEIEQAKKRWNPASPQVPASPSVQLTTDENGELTFTTPPPATPDPPFELPPAPVDIAQIVNAALEAAQREETRKLRDVQLEKVNLEMECMQKQHNVKMEILELKKAILARELDQLQ